MTDAAWFADVGDGPGPARVLDGLLARYREPHRHYHDEAHVRSVVATVDALLPGVAVDDPAAIRLAAWYHDAVYDPAAGAGANEAASAHLATEELTALGVPVHRVERVARLVLATADHVADGPDAAVLLDADLAVLAAPADRYARYVAGVRAEYAHVPDELWRVGRGAVLDTLLARSRLFVTAPASAWEGAARRNLTAERARLAG